MLLALDERLRIDAGQLTKLAQEFGGGRQANGSLQIGSLKLFTKEQCTKHLIIISDAVPTKGEDPRKLTLDAALEWVASDELVEVTPKSVRTRKAILDAEDRKKEERRWAAAG